MHYTMLFGSIQSAWRQVLDSPGRDHSTRGVVHLVGNCKPNADRSACYRRYAMAPIGTNTLYTCNEESVIPSEHHTCTYYPSNCMELHLRASNHTEHRVPAALTLPSLMLTSTSILLRLELGRYLRFIMVLWCAVKKCLSCSGPFAQNFLFWRRAPESDRGPLSVVRTRDLPFNNNNRSSRGRKQAFDRVDHVAIAANCAESSLLTSSNFPNPLNPSKNETFHPPRPHQNSYNGSPPAI